MRFLPAAASLALLLFVSVQAGAQTRPVASATFTPTTVYEPPRSSVGLPSAWDLASVRAARGNLTRWRDSERERIGAYEFDWTTGVARNSLPEVGGYFAYFGDGVLPGGIIEAHWSQPAAGVGQRGHLSARYTHRRLICEATLERAYTDLSEAAYLGSRWLPEFDTLDAELEAQTLRVSTRALPDGVTVSFLQITDFSRFYPPSALERHVEGVVEMACFVRPDHRLVCGTVSEAPIGHQFGEAAQRAMQTARVQDVASNGEPVAGVCFGKTLRFAHPH